MRKAWIVSALAPLLPLFFAACTNSGDRPPERILPDPAELIAERRMETIRAHRMLIVGIAPSPLAEMERKLVAALLDGTGFRFRIISADRQTLGAFLRGGRADIICGLFTEQELKDAFLNPAAPYLRLSFYLLHHKDFREPEKANAGEELLYPDSAPEIFFLPGLQTKLLKRPVPRETIFREMEQAPGKRAAFLSSVSISKETITNLKVRPVHLKGGTAQLYFGLRRPDSELKNLLTARLAKLSADGTLEKLTRSVNYQPEIKMASEVKHETK